MRKKILSMLALLLTVVSGAWATDYLYLVIDGGGTSATLMYGEPASGNPYYVPTTPEWDLNTYTGNLNELKTITVDATCNTFGGTSLHCLFDFWGSMTTINDLGNLNTSDVTNMNSMFEGCGSLTTLDLTGLDTSKVDDMGCMFYACKNLTTIYVGDGWKTAAVTYSIDMFKYCNNLPNYNDAEFDKTHANTGAGGYLSFKLTAHEGELGEYWATYWSNVTNYKTSAQVFKVNLNTTTAKITMTEITDGIVNSDEGVVLKSTSASITMTPSNAASTGDYSGNSLVGTGFTTHSSGPSDYALNKGSKGVGFYKLKVDGFIYPNKAYLVYGGSSAPEYFLFDDATDIESVSVNDGEIHEVYDLQGRRVSQPTKGLYIVNGKKVIIK